MNTDGYRLVALEMDGTLLNTEHETSAYTREVIRRVAQSGKVAAISTGRCLSELWEHFEKLPDINYAICENGAYVYNIRNKEIIHRITLTDEQVRKVFEAAEGFDLKLQFFRDSQSCMQCSDISEFHKYHVGDFTEVFVKTAVFVEDLRTYYAAEKGGIGKFNLYCTCEADKRTVWERIVQNVPELTLSDSIGIGVEVSPCGATKAVGLEKLCSWLGMTTESAMAVGDASNDIEILKKAGLSVAMGNATDEVKAVADVITEDCDHDGAARAIQRYMLREEI